MVLGVVVVEVVGLALVDQGAQQVTDFAGFGGGGEGDEVGFECVEVVDAPGVGQDRGDVAGGQGAGLVGGVQVGVVAQSFGAADDRGAGGGVAAGGGGDQGAGGARAQDLGVVVVVGVPGEGGEVGVEAVALLRDRGDRGDAFLGAQGVGFGQLVDGGDDRVDLAGVSGGQAGGDAHPAAGLPRDFQCGHARLLSCVSAVTVTWGSDKTENTF